MLCWVDTNTGEILDGPRAESIEVDLPSAPAEAIKTRRSDGTGTFRESLDWLPDWYLKQQVRLDAEEAALKAQHARRIAEVKARRRAIDWRWKDAVERQVRFDLDNQKGKKKSVNYSFGKAGWRSSKKVVVEDESKAIAWALFNCRPAIKASTSLIKSELPPEVEVPGIRRESGDSFFASAAKAKA